jgi:hypothetical protein
MKQTETFYEFCNRLRGYKIYTRKGIEVPKFLLYWSGLNPIQVREKFILEKRTIEINYIID